MGINVIHGAMAGENAIGQKAGEIAQQDMQRAQMELQREMQRLQIGAQMAMANQQSANRFQGQASQNQLDRERMAYGYQSEQDQLLARLIQQQQATTGQQESQQLSADLSQRNWNLQNTPANNYDEEPGQQQAGPGRFVLPKPREVATNYTQAVSNQQALRGLSDASTQRLMEGVGQGDPQAIELGLERGILRFSPQQKQEINRLQDAMDRLDRDPRMSPADRAAGERILTGRLKSIRPMMTPTDERPRDINEQIQQAVGVWTDPTSGKSYPMSLDRNGIPKVLEIPEPKESKTDGPQMVAQAAFKDPKIFQGIYESAYKRAQEAMPADDAGNRAAPSEADVLAHVKRALAAQQMLIQESAQLSGQGGATTGTGPTPGDPQNYNSQSQFDLYSEKFGRVIPPAEMQQIIEHATKERGQSLQEVGATLGLRQIPRGGQPAQQQPLANLSGSGAGALNQPAGATGTAQPKPPAPAATPTVTVPKEAVKRVAQSAPVVKSIDDYNNLPSGTVYRDPNGKLKVKK